MSLFRKKIEPRGVTVYTGATAEHYATADTWARDDKGTLDVLDASRQLMATFIDKSWFRVEAGSPRPATIEAPRNTD